MQNVITLVLGGGQGARLYPLTKYRSKPAVPLAGKYRLIDIPLSNCLNSGLRRIYVLTQFLSVSLHRHIRQTYRFDQFSGGYVELLAAQQTMEQGTDWYEGTADAVRKNVRYLEQRGIDYVLILSGDQLYRMNYLDMLHTHTQSGADVSIAALPVSREAAKSFGIMRLDESGRVNGFVEKPTTDEEIDSVRMSESWFAERGLHIHGRDCLASMGIYLFNRDLLVETLRSTTHEDFGRQVFPSLIEPKHVQVHPFDGYWEDIGTIKAFYDANLQLASRVPHFDLAKPESLMYSRARFLPPSRFDGANITSSLIADGCRIGHGAQIENSVIGLRCVVGENAVIKDSVIMGSDDYETDLDLQEDVVHGVPPIGIGANTTIVGAIVDKNCRIGSGVKIEKPADAPPHVEGERFVIRDGITVIEKDACLPNGWQLTLNT
jgi:glucose-1-phosphate adenylyltransferase